MQLLLCVGAVVVALLCLKFLLKPKAPKSNLGPLSVSLDDDVVTQLPQKKVAVVTGGRGFVGRSVVNELLKSAKFDEIRVFDIGNPTPGDDPNVTWVKGDLLKMDEVLKVMEGVDSVIHLAAIIDMRSSEYFEGMSRSVNTQGTWNVVEACIRRGVPNLVYLSTNCTLCVGQDGIEVETEQDVLEVFAKTIPHSAYGRSKKEATQLVLAGNGLGRLRTLVLLPGVIIGPEEPKFMANVMNQSIMPLSEAFAGSLNFLSRTSVVSAILCSITALRQSDVSKVAGRIFIISDVLENFAGFETAIRKALGRPHGRHINSLMPLVCALSEFINWLTNDKFNHILFQGNFAAMELSKRAPQLKSTHEAQNVLGWKPVSREALIQELVNYYKPKKQ